MKLSKFSEEQVAYALRQVEAGTPVGDACRQLGVSEATFYDLGWAQVCSWRQRAPLLRWWITATSLAKGANNANVLIRAHRLVR